jgi:hypothetical protein
MIQQVAKTEERKKTLEILAKHYEQAQRYSKSKVHMTDDLLKRSISRLMFFAGGGASTGTNF